MLGLLACSIALLTPVASPQAPAGATAIERRGEAWEVRRDGEPFAVRGAVGVSRFEELAAAGANTVRVVDPSEIDRVLDQAARHGLTVVATLPVPAAREGFDWTQARAVDDLIARLDVIVERHRAHPALLMWSLGNEIELDYETTASLWRGVERLARRVKELDPHHPVIVSLAEVSAPKIASILELCPSLDAIGVNTFAGMATLPRRLRAFGWDKPFFVTEFGPFGPWEVNKTPWGAAREPYGQQKEDVYLSNYLRVVQGERGWCLGAFAFLWGHRYEGTPTWFGMFLPTGERLGTVDVMTFAWTGRWPANRSPRVFYIESGLDLQTVEPGSRHEALVIAFDPDGDPLTYRWEVRAEMTGDNVEPRIVHDALLSRIGNRAVIRAPTAEGAYRLFVYVLDGQGNAATANLPFYVRARTGDGD